MAIVKIRFTSLLLRQEPEKNERDIATVRLKINVFVRQKILSESGRRMFRHVIFTRRHNPRYIEVKSQSTFDIKVLPDIQIYLCQGLWR